jgi:1-deoxy-D-xylulose-5-phosphate reductoisomerase
LALTAGKIGQSMPAVLSGSNEIAVRAFLEGKIGFLDIPQVVEKTMERHRVFPIDSIDQAVEADRWAQSMAREILEKMVGN